MHLRRTNNSDDYCENSPSRDVAREARYSVAGEKREVLQGVHHGSQSRRQTDVEIPIHMSNNQNGATEDNASGRRAPGKQKQGRHLHVHLVKVKKKSMFNARVCGSFFHYHGWHVVLSQRSKQSIRIGPRKGEETRLFTLHKHIYHACYLHGHAPFLNTTTKLNLTFHTVPSMAVFLQLLVHLKSEEVHQRDVSGIQSTTCPTQHPREVPV